jgi:hypothetical protein
MVERCKISHDWGTNTIIIQGTTIVKNIHATKKLGVTTTKGVPVRQYIIYVNGLHRKEEESYDIL